MNLHAITAALLLSTLPLSALARDRMADGFPDLPHDARQVAERSVACKHFSGEANGTGDARDRDVARTLRRLRCDRVDNDMAAIKRKYRRNEDVLRILSEADHD